MGYTLVELLFAVGLMTTLAGVATPPLLAGLDDIRTAGAARYVAGRLQRVRMEAVTRNVNIALRFRREDLGISYSVYRDGNRNGVLSRDIERGLDVAIYPAERLTMQFAGVDFGVLPNLPAVDSSSSPPGADPLRIGSADVITFAPLGTSSAGSLYVLGQGGAQYVVRIYGETGRTRILKFDPRGHVWRTLG